MPKNWTPNSWRNFPIKQQPVYENPGELKKIENQLANFPPLVSFDEIENLKSELARVAEGQAFLLQGGDCAESFTEFSHDKMKKPSTTSPCPLIAAISSIQLNLKKKHVWPIQSACLNHIFMLRHH